MFRAAGGDGREVARDGGVLRAGQARDAAFGFARAPGRLVVEGIQAAPGVGVQREARRRLGHQRIARGEQDRRA
jgi:hypothetical protein